mmetsp:Transcript_9396/g.32469  ORF Transcript_9396/g.32469 Transcript_9396/m.32469 type:complete len:213 (+) Transcript_9396:3351-3989(+)
MMVSVFTCSSWDSYLATSISRDCTWDFKLEFSELSSFSPLFFSVTSSFSSLTTFIKLIFSLLVSVCRPFSFLSSLETSFSLSSIPSLLLISLRWCLFASASCLSISFLLCSISAYLSAILLASLSIFIRSWTAWSSLLWYDRSILLCSCSIEVIIFLNELQACARDSTSSSYFRPALSSSSQKNWSQTRLSKSAFTLHSVWTCLAISSNAVR